MHLSKFFHTNTGRHIMSAILGFGLATLFRVVCKERNCIIFKAPKLDDVQDKTFKHNGKCYKFSSQTQKCVSDANSVVN
jgi:hypothetical protein